MKDKQAQEDINILSDRVSLLTDRHCKLLGMVAALAAKLGYVWEPGCTVEGNWTKMAKSKQKK